MSQFPEMFNRNWTGLGFIDISSPVIVVSTVFKRLLRISATADLNCIIENVAERMCYR